MQGCAAECEQGTGWPASAVDSSLMLSTTTGSLSFLLVVPFASLIKCTCRLCIQPRPTCGRSQKVWPWVCDAHWCEMWAADGHVGALPFRMPKQNTRLAAIWHSLSAPHDENSCFFRLKSGALFPLIPFRPSPKVAQL